MVQLVVQLPLVYCVCLFGAEIFAWYLLTSLLGVSKTSMGASVAVPKCRVSCLTSTVRGTAKSSQSVRDTCASGPYSFFAFSNSTLVLSGIVRWTESGR